MDSPNALVFVINLSKCIFSPIDIILTAMTATRTGKYIDKCQICVAEMNLTVFFIQICTISQNKRHCVKKALLRELIKGTKTLTKAFNTQVVPSLSLTSIYFLFILLISQIQATYIQ